MTTFTIPAKIYQAVALAQSTDKTRYYLGGVFVEQDSITATNGHILIKYDMETSLKGEPLICFVDASEKGFKEKCAGDLLMRFDLEKKIVEFFSSKDEEQKARLSVCGFKVIDGTFPQTSRVIPDHSGSKGLPHICLSPKYIATFQKAARLLGDHRDPCIGFTFGESLASPVTIHIGDKEHSQNVTAVQMPIRTPF